MRVIVPEFVMVLSINFVEITSKVSPALRVRLVIVHALVPEFQVPPNAWHDELSDNV